MAKRSEYTKKSIIILYTLKIVDALILVLPLIIYFFIGLFNDEAMVTEKVGLVASAMITLILTVFNILAKKNLRSIIWILVLGLYVAVNDLKPLIITLAITSLLDEFLLAPLIERQKVDVISNKTIDKRS